MAERRPKGSNLIKLVKVCIEIHPFFRPIISAFQTPVRRAFISIRIEPGIYTPLRVADKFLPLAREAKRIITGTGWYRNS